MWKLGCCFSPKQYIKLVWISTRPYEYLRQLVSFIEFCFCGYLDFTDFRIRDKNVSVYFADFLHCWLLCRRYLCILWRFCLRSSVLVCFNDVPVCTYNGAVHLLAEEQTKMIDTHTNSNHVAKQNKMTTKMYLKKRKKRGILHRISV